MFTFAKVAKEVLALPALGDTDIADGITEAQVAKVDPFVIAKVVFTAFAFSGFE